MKHLLIGFLFSLLPQFALAKAPIKAISVKDFGTTSQGEKVKVYTLTNSKGMSVSIINYGAIVTSIKAPDKNGVFEDVVLGYDKLKPYEKESPYFGAVAGRYANRIAQGQFSLGKTKYKLAINNGVNHLHGGLKGFDKVVYEVKKVSNSPLQLKLHYLSRDGQENYPGNLDLTVSYILTEDNGLQVEFQAKTDKETVINLAQHSYFNLNGNGKGDILEHILKLNSSYYTPIDQGLIPTGEIRSVKNTPFDFTSPKAIGKDINVDENRQILFGKGYDHNFVLKGEKGTLRKVATVWEPVSGREMSVFTTQPGIQFYSGNFLDGKIKGKGGQVYAHRSGFCLETQHFPNSPNTPHFPDTRLRPGDVYKETTVYQFGVRS